MEMIIKAGKQSDKDPFEFVLTTSDLDRDGDIVEPKGIDLTDFKKNPIALYLHDHRTPIGTWGRLRVEGNKLLGRLNLAAPGTSTKVDMLRKLVEQRILRAVSIGFTSLKHKPLERGLHFIRTRLFEASLVPVPANQNALQIKALGLSAEEIKTFFTEPGEGLLKSAAKSPTKKKPNPLAIPTGTKPTKKTRGEPMDIAKKIEAKQDKLISIKDRLTELKALAESDENYEYTEDETTEIETLTDEQDAVIKSIESLEKIEQGLIKKAVPVQKTQFKTMPGVKEEQPGQLLVKQAVCNLIAHVENKNIESVVNERYADDDRLAAIMKTAVAVADTTTAGWAAELVGESIQGFLDFLKPVSVYAQLAAMGIGINFGKDGKVTIPRRAGNNTALSGAFIGENGVIPLKRTTLASQSLYPFKMAVITTATKELVRRSTPQIEAVLRQGMLDDTAVALDHALLDTTTTGAAVTGVKPASILNGVTGHASNGTTAQNIIDDLKTLFNTLVTANAGSKPVLIMNSARVLGLSTVTLATGGFLFRTEVESGRILNVPFISSTTVPVNDVIIVDAAYFATAFGTPEIEASDTATLVMANADSVPPTMANEAGTGNVGTPEQVPPDGGIPVTIGTGAAAAGATAHSMFQQWSVALRFVMPVSWSMIRPGVIDRITGVNW